MGNGNTIVEFFSAEMVLSVCNTEICGLGRVKSYSGGGCGRRRVDIRGPRLLRLAEDREHVQRHREDNGGTVA